MVNVLCSGSVNTNGAWNANDNPYCDLIGFYQILVMSQHVCEGLAREASQ